MMHLVAVLLIGNSTFFKMFFEMISLSERFCGILLLSVLLYGVEETEKNIWNLTVGWVGTILNNVMCVEYVWRIPSQNLQFPVFWNFCREELFKIHSFNNYWEGGLTSLSTVMWVQIFFAGAQSFMLYLGDHCRSAVYSLIL